METLDQIAARWQLALVTGTRGTARTYASCLGRFEAWCRAQGRCWCPANAETVRACLEALTKVGMQPQSTMGMIRAINAGHRALGLPLPLPMHRSLAEPRVGKGLAVDERYYRAADRMLDPGWTPPHLAALSAPSPPWDGSSSELAVSVAAGVLAERARQDEETALMLERTSLARRSHEAYCRQLAYFLAWCHENQAAPLPADPNVLARYLGWYGTQARDGRGRSPDAMNQTVAAIRYVHHLQDLPSPTDYPRIRRIVKGHRANWGKAKRQAQPFTTEEIRALCEHIDQRGGVTGIRDKAVILLTYASCSRRSETTSRRDYDWLPDDQEICLRIEDITIDRRGLAMRLVKTKTANAAVEHLPPKHVSYGEDAATCPVTAVRAWLAVMRRYGVTTGPLFPCVHAVGDRTLGEVRIEPRALNPNIISILLKHYATLAGLGAVDRISGHSLRRGHVHEATRRKADLLEVADQGAWRSLETVRLYANDRVP